MDERRKQTVQEYLQDQDAQERIQVLRNEARSEATVTIGRVAKLFQFSENQLRDWEKRGWLSPQRPEKSLLPEQEGKNINRHRQYSLNELDKLAIIRELINAKYTPSEINQNLDIIRNTMNLLDAQGEPAAEISKLRIDKQRTLPLRLDEARQHLHIDQRVDQANGELFWRFYAAQALRLSLMLIQTEHPGTIIGLFIPLEEQNQPVGHFPSAGKLPSGECLIGWLRQDQSFYMFLDNGPTFEQPSDFHIHPLGALLNNSAHQESPEDKTLLVVQRKTWPLTIKATVLNTIRRLLKPLYESAQEFSPYLRQGSQELLFPATSFNSNTGPSEKLLHDLANMVIRLGNIDHQARWRFCCILLPDILQNNVIMPMPQCRLIIRAQSDQSPHAIGTTISPDKSIMSLSHRAYLSGQITYRPAISKEDYTIALREVEGEMGSAIAIPIAREDGLAIGVIYVVSHKHEIDAFSEDDQRILRIIGQMVGELLMSFRYGQLAAAKLKNMIEKPTVVDEVLGTFLSEHMFIRRLGSLLTDIQSTMPEAETEIGKKELSIISIDIDSQSSITNMYGDRVVRNLSLQLGEKIYSQLRLLFSESSGWRFYYIYGGRFYIILDGVPLDIARTKAGQLQVALSGEYKVDALRVARDQVTSPNDMLKLPGISVRLGVASYPYWKLTELLSRYTGMNPVASVIGLIIRYLDIALSEGKPGEVRAWDRKKWRLAPWSPSDS